MKQIKFRAWDTVKKEIVSDAIALPFFMTDVYRYNDGMNTNNHVMVGINNLRFNIMQFTGLTDKNGKEIYEGDILKFKEWSWSRKNGNNYKEMFVKVVWYHAGFMLEGSKFEWNFEEGEVVGNIHENMDLLKVSV